MRYYPMPERRNRAESYGMQGCLVLIETTVGDQESVVREAGLWGPRQIWENRLGEAIERRVPSSPPESC